jgi:hypothetical protein
MKHQGQESAAHKLVYTHFGHQDKWQFVRYKLSLIHYKPIAVAARSKARTVFARSNIEIVGLNPT